jgi:acyl-CoA dehydrogenase
MSLLQECIGAKGFESSGYFEMALRDIQLIPSLEGSMHINLGLAVQFIPRYFDRPDSTLGQPPSLVGSETPSRENPYLMEARAGSTHAVGFLPFLDAYRPLGSVKGIAPFLRQVEVFRKIATARSDENDATSDMQFEMAFGQCFATVTYGQLIAENAVRLDLPEAMTTSIFAVLVEDLSTLALRLAGIPGIGMEMRESISKMIEVPNLDSADWEFVGRHFENRL